MPTHHTTAEILRLRQGPGTDQPIVDRLLHGTALDLLEGPLATNWARVKAYLRGTTEEGWVSAAYIEPIAEPAWLAIARHEMGVTEIPGPEHAARILEYQQTCSNKATTDEVPWCSTFINWCIQQAGKTGTGSAAAISWATWGQPLTEPRLGCVVVFKRYDPNTPNAAHVSFFMRKRTPLLDVLGGNQSNSVRVSGYPISDVLAYRWPN